MNKSTTELESSQQHVPRSTPAATVAIVPTGPRFEPPFVQLTLSVKVPAFSSKIVELHQMFPALIHPTQAD